MSISAVYDKLEKLVERLPKALQSPILREVRPIKTLFLAQRPPRLLLLGDRAASRSTVVNALFGEAAAHQDEDHLQDGTWQLFASGRGKLRMLDARRPVAPGMVRRALAAEAPDLCLFLRAGSRAVAEQEEDQQRVREFFGATLSGGGLEVPVIGVATASTLEAAEETRAALHEEMERGPGSPLSAHVVGAFVLALGRPEIHRLAALIATDLPGEAKLEMARLSGVQELQMEVAAALIKSVATICGAVGTQPIPLADFPILTTLQAAMVAGIMHISGRELSVKLAGEWIGALGANIGLGLVMREGARAALKFIPVWGDFVSGGIAAAGTYAVGKAAAAYFIQGASLPDAQRLFRERKKARPKLQ